MAVSTIQSALGATGGINKQSQDIINQINGNRSAEQMIGEYFGLRKEVQYSDDGKEVIGMINEFKDREVLQKKKVEFVQYFKDKGMTEEMFKKATLADYVYVYTPKITIKPTENEQSNDNSTTEPKGEPALPNIDKRTRKNKK